ncbi:diacylglycerol kinase [Microbacteriaceae bacterium VKM Ac-2855]|nr:diacylglycerol kinase [Microbacteriaceae bacterium VKM Ac-2855]
MPTDVRTTPAAGRIVVAANPQAAFGRRRDAGDEVAALLRSAGYAVDFCRADSYVALRDVVRAALDPVPDALVVVGGDGMVHLGAGLLAEGPIALGIVATGTGNDAARSLGLPISDVSAATARLLASLRSSPRSIDLARVDRVGAEREWFVCVLSAGFDAVVNERANRMRHPRGAGRYVLALLRELVFLRPLRYRLVIDGVSESVDALLVSVANGGSIGGGMRIAPSAVLDDGELDLVVVHPLGRIAFLRFFPRVFRGSHVTLSAVSLRRCRSVRIEVEGVTAYADGERIGPSPWEVTMVPGALRVLV